jgi:hypothetical protein
MDETNETTESNFEMLSGSLLERLETAMELLGRISSDAKLDADDDGSENDETETDEEDGEADYADAYAGGKEELKKYVEKFREYAREIKKDAEAVYGEGGNAAGKTRETTEADFGMKSPSERGHKMGCGCPGCSAFREFFGIKLDGKNVNRSFDSFFHVVKPAERKETGKYDETGARPCGGSMYNHFHGERADLKNVFGKYTGSFNLGKAGF